MSPRKPHNLHPIANVLRKEWLITFRSLNNTLFITLVPVLITLQIHLYIYLALRFAGADLIMNSIIGKGIEKWMLQFSIPQGLTSLQILQIFFYSQFPIYQLLIPCMIAMSFATFSIVEEKQTRTLEPLLATPVRTGQLLLGKALSGVIPSVIMCYICTAIFLGGVMLIGSKELLRWVLNPQWWLSLFVLVPLVSLISFMLGVSGSSKAQDSKSAQNIAVVVILPILALVALQTLGFVIFSPVKLILLSLALLFLNWIALKTAVKLFRRETILIRWK
jgi:ABC-2 type transport system permease protein